MKTRLAILIAVLAFATIRATYMTYSFWNSYFGPGSHGLIWQITLNWLMYVFTEVGLNIAIALWSLYEIKAEKR